MEKGGGKGGKSCPKSDKVSHERVILKSLLKRGQDFPPFPPHELSKLYIHVSIKPTTIFE
jgi:hypothetical protein